MEELTPKQILINKIKQRMPYIVIAILSAVLVWQFGWKEFKDWKNGIYQEAFSAGQQDVSNFIANQLSQQGFLKIKISEGLFLTLQPVATSSE